MTNGLGKIRFDPTITLGNIVGIVLLVLAIVGGCTRIEQRFTILETKVDAMWTNWVKDRASQ